MNPLRWRREHRLSWVLVSLIGGMLGMLVAWSTSPFYRDPDLPMLLSVFNYWPWPVFSALIAALAFYTVRILQAANQVVVGAVVEHQPTNERLWKNLKQLEQVVRVTWNLATTVFGFAFWGMVIIVLAMEMLQKLLGPRN